MAVRGWWLRTARREGAARGLREARGQTLIESCLVLAVVCLILFGLFEISQLFAAQEILDYAAARGARAETVGFNRFMVWKTERIGAIPNAGPMTTPTYTGGPAGESAAELPRLPLYLAAENWGRVGAILNYEDWDSIQYSASMLLGQGVIHEHVGQAYSLTNFPFSRAFYAADVLPMQGEAMIESHYPLYMNDDAAP